VVVAAVICVVCVGCYQLLCTADNLKILEL
jgi:hypothetical protein